MDSHGYIVPSLLIMDQASMHITEDIIKEIEKYDTEIIFIPKGMTRILQPLDVSINKPFKTLIRKKYAEYCCNKNLSYIKISNNLIINWVSDIWWDEFAINRNMIKYSFRITGISNNLNGSENLLFKAYQKLREEIVIEQDKDEKEEIAENELEHDFEEQINSSKI